MCENLIRSAVGEILGTSQCIFTWLLQCLFVTKVKTEPSEIKQLCLIRHIRSKVRPLGFGYQNTDSYFVLLGCFSRDPPPAAEGPCHSERSGRTAGMVFQKLQLSRRRRTVGEEPVGLETKIELLRSPSKSALSCLMYLQSLHVNPDIKVQTIHLLVVSPIKRETYTSQQFAFKKKKKCIIYISHCVTEFCWFVSTGSYPWPREKSTGFSRPVRTLNASFRFW